MDSSYDDDNSVNIYSTYESTSSNNGDLEHRKIEVDIWDLAGAAGNEKSDELQDVAPEIAMLDLLQPK